MPCSRHRQRRPGTPWNWASTASGRLGCGVSWRSATGPVTGGGPVPERRRKAPVRRRWLSGPGVVEARDHLIPAFALGAPVIAGTAVLGALCGSTVRPAAGLLVVQGGSRGGNRPALAVHGEAQLCVVGLPVAEFGTGFGVRRVAVAARAEGEVGAVIPALVRW